MSAQRNRPFEGWLDARTYALRREDGVMFIRLDVPVDPARVFPARSGWYGLGCGHLSPPR